MLLWGLYVGYRFQDWTDFHPMKVLSQFDPELGKSGERIVFVENAETGVMEAKSAGYVAVGTPLDEDDGDDDSHLFGVLDGSFPGEEAPLYGWGTSTGPRDNPAGMCLGIAGG